DHTLARHERLLALLLAAAVLLVLFLFVGGLLVVAAVLLVLLLAAAARGRRRTTTAAASRQPHQRDRQAERPSRGPELPQSLREPRRWGGMGCLSGLAAGVPRALISALAARSRLII